MKSIYIVAACVVMMTSCSKYLDEDNKSNGSASTDVFYKSAVGYKSLINACYASLRNIWGNEPFLFSAGTDLWVIGKQPAPAGISTYASLGNTEASVADFYRRAYVGIQLCNTAIDYAEKTEVNDQLPILKAEAMFLRAFYYFNLVQQFGGVPIVTKVISSPESSFERKSVADVYSMIIQDLESILTTTMPAKNTGTSFGRVDKRAVNHFLSKIYLTKGWEQGVGTNDDFDKAITYGKAAIGSSTLNIPFEDVFKQGNEKNDEIIFSVQYDAASMVSSTNDGNMQQAMFGTAFENIVKGRDFNKNSNLIPGRRVYEVFQADDKRYNATFLTLIYTYASDFYTKPASELANTKITHYYPPYWATSDVDIATWRAINPTQRATTNVHKFNDVMFLDVNNYARAGVRKFDDPNSEVSVKGSRRDVFLARLAETYLNVAEAYLKKDGNGSNAVTYINEVRRRAGTSLATAGEITIDYILDERVREMAGEYCRWNDLKRTNKLKEYASMYNSDIKALITLGVDPFKGTDGKDKILRPIPSIALEANKANIEQNPGY